MVDAVDLGWQIEHWNGTPDFFFVTLSYEVPVHSKVHLFFRSGDEPVRYILDSVYGLATDFERMTEADIDAFPMIPSFSSIDPSHIHSSSYRAVLEWVQSKLVAGVHDHVSIGLFVPMAARRVIRHHDGHVHSAHPKVGLCRWSFYPAGFYKNWHYASKTTSTAHERIHNHFDMNEDDDDDDGVTFVRRRHEVDDVNGLAKFKEGCQSTSTASVFASLCKRAAVSMAQMQSARVRRLGVRASSTAAVQPLPVDAQEIIQGLLGGSRFEAATSNNDGPVVAAVPNN